MELRFQAGGPESWSADAVIVFLSEDEKLEKAYPELLDAAPWMSIAPGMRDFHGKKGEMGLLYGPPAHPLSRAVVVGLGKLDALTYAETLEEIRKGAGAAAVRCRELGVDTLALPVSGLARFNADVERTIEEIVCAAMLGLWRNKAFKSKEPEDADPRWLALLFCDANVPDFPRLAARRGDVELLANHFLHKFSAALGKRVQAINAEARGLLYRYPWPGNVRELENAIERAVNVCGGQELMPCDFPSAMLEHEAVSGPGRKNGWLWAQETETIRKAIRETNGNLRQAAILLGISRSTLYLKIKKSSQFINREDFLLLIIESIIFYLDSSEL